jgi:hypothetical protein
MPGQRIDVFVSPFNFTNYKTIMLRNILRGGNRLATASTRRNQRLYSTVPPPKQSGGPTFPAMLAVASMGFAAYYTIVKSREGNSKLIKTDIVNDN